MAGPFVKYLNVVFAIFVLGSLSAFACWMVQLPLTDFRSCTSKVRRIYMYIPFLDRYLEAHPSSWKAYFARALSYDCLRDNQLALADYNHAYLLAPNKVVILRRRALLQYHLGDYKSALDDLNNLIQNFKWTLPVDFSLRSYTLSKLHRYNEALSDAQRALDESPSFAQAYTAKAYAQLGLDNYAAALSDCKTAQTLSPDARGWALCSAEVFEKEEKWNEAVAACNQMLSRAPYNGEARLLRAKAYNKLGKFKEAADDAMAAICQDPGNTEVYIARAQALYHLQKYEDAFYDAIQAINIDASLEHSKELSFFPYLKSKFAHNDGS